MRVASRLVTALALCWPLQAPSLGLCFLSTCWALHGMNAVQHVGPGKACRRRSWRRTFTTNPRPRGVAHRVHEQHAALLRSPKRIENQMGAQRWRPPCLACHAPPRVPRATQPLFVSDLALYIPTTRRQASTSTLSAHTHTERHVARRDRGRRRDAPHAHRALGLARRHSAKGGSPQRYASCAA